LVRLVVSRKTLNYSGVMGTYFYLHPGRQVRVILMLFALFSGQGLYAADSEQEETPASETINPVPEDAPDIFGLGWLDRTQSAASSSTNALAGQIDRFFGVQRSDIEAAYSSWRLTSNQSWNSQDHIDAGMRLRGKLYLPRVNERVSLIFAEEDGDGTTYQPQNAASVASEESTRINLELNVANKEAHRLFFRVGARSGLKGRVSMRYRYEPTTAKRTINRYTQAVYFKDGDGFGTFSRYQLDHALNESSLLRWTNDLRLEESFNGAEYTTALEFLTLRDNETALSWYTRVNGETRPDYVVSYDLGLRYRRNIYREWLYMELEPGFTWRKDAYALPRQGIPYIFLRLEMAIGTFN